jgi:co-chaperonin GroES (HSP10)
MMTETVAGDTPVKASLWRILVDPLPVQTERGGIALPPETIQMQEYRRYVGKVLDIGPLAFNDDRFDNDNGDRLQACKVGDWIIYGRNNGIDIHVTEGQDEVRSLKLINDDQVLGVVEDISRMDIPL